MSVQVSSSVTAKVDIAALAQSTYEILCAQDDLSPRNTAVNACLSRYVSDLITAQYQSGSKNNVLGRHDVAGLRPRLLPLLSRAEYEMELYFAKLMTRHPVTDVSGLSLFWYRRNYELLVRQEIDGMAAMGLLEGVLADNRPLCFVGSGPLPLTVIDFYLQTGKSCVCIEKSPEAAALSRRLLAAIGLGDKIKVEQVDGANVDYGRFAMVMIASLVQNREEVLDSVRQTAPGCIVAMRSAEGLMTLLYEPVDVQAVCTCGFRYVGIASATKETINSTCFFVENAAAGPETCLIHGVRGHG